MDLLPELWLHVFRLVPFRRLHGCCVRVCKTWQTLAYLSVREFPAHTQLHLYPVLARYQALERLVFYDQDAATLQGLTSLRSLTHLHVQSLVDDACLARLTNLCILQLDHRFSPISDASLSCLTNLTYLELNDSPRVNGESLLVLPRLTDLTIGYGSAVDANALRGLTGLTRLCLSETACGGDTALARMSHLRALELHGELPGITAAGVGRLTQLEELSIGYNCDITDNGISSLRRLTRLCVEGDDCAITTEGIARLTSLTRLEVAGLNRIRLGHLVTSLPNLCWIVDDFDLYPAKGYAEEVRKRDIYSHTIAH